MAVSRDFTVQWNQADFDRWRGTNVQGAMVRALRKAGVEAIRRARAESNRYVRSRKRMKVKDSSRGLVMVFPKSSKNIEDLVWRLKFSGKPVPVINYGSPRQTRKGVTVSINKGKRVLIRHAFIATMRSGHEGVFKRTGKKRLPIRELYSSSVADVGSDAGYLESVAQKASVTFETAFQRIFAIDLSKRYA